MKKNCLLLVSTILAGCVSSPYEIKQNILEDDTLTNTISEYKNKTEYQEILEYKKFIDSLNDKYNSGKTLTKSEYQRLQDMDIGNIQQITKDHRVRFSQNYATALVAVCSQCHNIECETHKDRSLIYSASPCCSNKNLYKDSIVNRISTLVDSFMEEQSTYCDKYNKGGLDITGCRDVKLTDGETLNSCVNYTKEKAVESCKQDLKLRFCDKLFNDTYANINISQVVSLQNQYATTQWEKATGCKRSKSTNDLYFYTVLQQTKDGTLAVVDHNYRPYGSAPEIVFITKNKTDSKLTDGERIPYGSTHEEIGTYKYTTTLGSVSTVKKYRRCESK